MERVIWAVDIHRKHVAPRVTARQYESFLPDAMPDSEVLQGLAEAHATLEGRSCRPGTPGSSAFFTALEEGRFDEAGRLAQETPQLLAAQDEDGKTGLMLAYDAGQHELVQRWVATPGAALNAKDTEGFALAHDVVRSDNVSVLGLLHKNGADLNIRTLGGFTPAIMCLDYRAEDCLRFLVQHRADLNVRSMGGRNVPEDLEQADLPEDVKKLVRDALLADRG